MSTHQYLKIIRNTKSMHCMAVYVSIINRRGELLFDLLLMIFFSFFTHAYTVVKILKTTRDLKHMLYCFGQIVTVYSN